MKRLRKYLYNVFIAHWEIEIDLEMWAFLPTVGIVKYYKRWTLSFIWLCFSINKDFNTK